MPEKTRKVKENLECILTEEETIKYSKDLANAIAMVAEAENSKKNFNDQIKATISGYEATIVAMTAKINAGKEYRLTDVQIDYDFEEGIKVYTRTDTGEMIRRMPIPDEERQIELPLEEVPLPEESDVPLEYEEASFEDVPQDGDEPSDPSEEEFEDPIESISIDESELPD